MRHEIVVEGKGPNLLLLHGLVPGPHAFDSLRASLASSHRLVVPSLPGYGRTAPVDGQYTIADTTRGGLTPGGLLMVGHPRAASAPQGRSGSRRRPPR